MRTNPGVTGTSRTFSLFSKSARPLLIMGMFLARLAERQSSCTSPEIIPRLPLSHVYTVQSPSSSPAMLAGLVTGFTTLNITNGDQLNI